MDRLIREQICLDVCPTSNVQLSVTPSLEDHPLPALLQAGVAVSLNADDPVLFDCGLLGEYELARATWGFDDPTLAQIARTSIQASGAPDSLKRQKAAEIEAWLAQPA